MTNKSEILKKMVAESETDCATTATEYLVSLVEVGMEYPNAESRVLEHFSGVSQEELSEQYDA